jgi:hypothetical protein
MALYLNRQKVKIDLAYTEKTEKYHQFWSKKFKFISRDQSL